MCGVQKVSNNCNNMIGSYAYTHTIGGALVPSIGTIPCVREVVERGQAEPINIGCDVCIQQTDELWLTIVCPITTPDSPFLADRFNFSATIRWEGENGTSLRGIGNTLFVQKPGTYKCIADIGNGQDTDMAETTISCEYWNSVPCGFNVIRTVSFL